MDEWRQRHAQHYAEFARTAGPALMGPDELAWRDRLHDELDNLRAAVIWSLDQDDDQLGVTIIAWLVDALLAEATMGLAAWAEAAIDRARRAPPGIRMAALCAAAFGVLYQGDRSRAHRLAVEAFQDGSPTDCPMPEVCYLTLMVTHYLVGEPDQTLEVARRGQRTLQQRGAPAYAHAALQGGLANLHGHWSDAVLAQQAASDYVRLARPTGNPTLLADAQFYLASATWTDNPGTALALLEEAIRVTEAGGSHVFYGYALGLRAQLRASAGQHGPALADLRHAVAFSRDKGDLFQGATVVDRAIMILSELGHLELAAFAGVAITAGPFTNLSVMPLREIPERDRTLTRLRTDLGDEQLHGNRHVGRGDVPNRPH